MVNIVTKYINCFEKLKIDNIDNLLECFANNIIFIDPFNQIKGKKNIKNMFLKMFSKTKNPNFKILYTIGNSNKTIIKWRFKCEIFKKRISFIGLSEIKIKKNLIYRHEDFWDSGKNIYSQLPILGNIFRKFHN